MGSPEPPIAVSSAEVADHLACRHKLALDRAAAPTAPAPVQVAGPDSGDPTRDLIMLVDATLRSEAIGRDRPAEVHLPSPSGGDRSVPIRDVAAFVRRARARAEAFVADPYPTTARPCDHCRRCPHQARCQADWTERDDVALVAGAFGRVIEQLATNGITTATQLADAPADPPPDVDARRFRTLRRQARLQIAARSGPDRYEVLSPDEHPGGGFSLLPRPDTGDLFFDLEGDPHCGNGGLEYLWGLSDVRDDYRSWWGHSPSDERAAFETVMDLLTDHLESHPNAHVFHYAPYETDVLRRLALRHASREDQLQRMLDDRRLVDLYRVVRQTIATSRPGYGMKQLEHFYRSGRETEVQDGLASVVAYEAWLADGNQARLDDIQAYNRDDCISTRQLRDWLEERRLESVQTYGSSADTPFSPAGRPVIVPLGSDRAERLAQRLRDGLPDAVDQRDETDRRNDLLLQLLEWHRREGRRRPSPEPAGEPDAQQVRLDAETAAGAEAVVATVEAVVSGGPQGRAFDAVLRRVPSLPPDVLRPLPGETAADVVVRAGCALDHGALAVQAPPGTGLTSTLDGLITALDADGRRVGLCHVDRVAEQTVAEVVRAQPDLTVGSVTDFADAEWSGAFDVLVLTGAGRASLADLAAIARSASSLIVCGDPAGLDRPRLRGRHPVALRRSVLAHLLDGEGTIPPNLGVLLDESTRLHPDICRVVSDIAYDGRVRSAAAELAPAHDETGLRWVPVDHTGRTTASPEEARAVAAVVSSLAADGRHDDVLVVAPFADQARLLTDTLPEDCRVGTLEQVQHETARVVLYSLTSSAPDGIPGGRNQIYSRHRLTAALSCARQLAVVVGNPNLLDARCRTPRHVAQLNALLRVVEAGHDLRLSVDAPVPAPR